MKSDLLFRNSAFGWIALATGFILMVPLVAMQLTAEVNWNVADFIAMGCLLFFTASLFVVVARRLSGKRRGFVAVIFVAAFLYVWAELAVGIFAGSSS